MTSTQWQDTKPVEALSIPIGINVKGRESGPAVRLELANNPRTLIVGPADSGKSALVRNLMHSCSIRNAKVVAIDTVGQGAELPRDAVSAIATEAADAIKILEDGVAEISKRRELVRKHGVATWRHLPRDVREEEDLHHLVIVINEYALTVQPVIISAGADPNGELDSEVREHNAAAARINSLVQDLLVDDAGPSGVHLVLSTGWLAEQQITQDDVDNFIVAMKPGSDVLKAMADLGAPSAADEAAAAEPMTMSSDHHSAVMLSRDTGQMQGFYLPYVPAK